MIRETDSSGRVPLAQAIVPPTTEATDVPSVLLFGPPKSGTVLLQKVIGGLGEPLKIRTFDFEGDLWAMGYELHELPAWVENVFVDYGYAYGPFRHIPTTFRLPIVDTHRSVLLMRDPRDLLVSFFLSVAKSHERPAGGTVQEDFDKARSHADEVSIDAFVLEHRRYYQEIIEGLEPISDKPGCRLFRYEDVIFEKRRWARELADHLGWDVSTEHCDAVADLNDVRRSSDRPGEHIHSVSPGDHRRKLQPETVEALTEHFAPILDRFGYDR